MTTEIINGHKVELYSGIDELPFARYQEYTRGLLIDAGIGSDLEAFARHIASIRRYNQDGEREAVENATVNLMQSVYFAMERTNPRMIAFAALVARIDGHERNDISETGLKATADELARMGGTMGRIREIFDTAKKKLKAKWPFSSPTMRAARKSANTQGK
jgi:mannose/cellobiose epimerase-like protein (N-acyl-D-glucosamine 2-epimerase family)